jgi:hypothetical protein
MEKQIAPDVPEMPTEAIEFAEEVGKLAEKYEMRSVEMDIQIDTGPYSNHRGISLLDLESKFHFLLEDDLVQVVIKSGDNIEVTIYSRSTSKIQEFKIAPQQLVELIISSSGG